MSLFLYVAIVAPAFGTGHFPWTLMRVHDRDDKSNFHRSLNELKEEVKPPNTYIESSAMKIGWKI